MTKPLPWERRFLSEWFFFLSTLLALGGCIGYLRYQEYVQIETQEKKHLESQAAVIEKNLAAQLHLANLIIKRILGDLPSWPTEDNGFESANLELQGINDALIGIRPILVIRADGTVVATSDKEFVGMNLLQREYFQTAYGIPIRQSFTSALPSRRYLTPSRSPCFARSPGRTVRLRASSLLA